MTALASSRFASSLDEAAAAMLEKEVKYHFQDELFLLTESLALSLVLSHLRSG